MADRTAAASVSGSDRPGAELPPIKFPSVKQTFDAKYDEPSATYFGGAGPTSMPSYEESFHFAASS
jgi:hypothetical protein